MEQTMTFYNGNTMPQVGLGVFRVPNDDSCQLAVQHAIESGYRSIDTAMIYGNEEKVGEGIAAGLAKTGLSREDLFITSKLWLDDYGRTQVEDAYQTSLDKLGLTYLDLYLMHWPGLDYAVMVDTWKGMETLYHQGRVSNIGVSNFNVTHLEKLLIETSIKQVINQVECHPYLTQKALKAYLDAQHIAMASWSPLMNGQILYDQTVREIASSLERSPAQIIVRWNVQHGIVTIPKSTTPSRIEENIHVFDFELSGTQMAKLDELDRGQRIGPDPLVFNGK